jgi:hypothetical protein
MVADDVTVLQLGHDGQVRVMPGVPKINLCEDAAIRLGHDVESLQRSSLWNFKVVVPVEHHDMVAEPVPLKRLYLLNQHSGKGLKISPLAGPEKFAGLQECIYGPLFPEDHPVMFPYLRAMSEQVEVTRLERPSYGCSVNQVVEVILHG